MDCHGMRFREISGHGLQSHRPCAAHLRNDFAAIAVSELLAEWEQNLCPRTSTKLDNGQLANLRAQACGFCVSTAGGVNVMSAGSPPGSQLTSSLVIALLIRFRDLSASGTQPISDMDLELSTARTTWYLRVSGMLRRSQILSFRNWEAMYEITYMPGLGRGGLGTHHYCIRPVSSMSSMRGAQTPISPSSC